MSTTRKGWPWQDWTRAGNSRCTCRWSSDHVGNTWRVGDMCPDCARRMARYEAEMKRVRSESDPEDQG